MSKVGPLNIEPGGEDERRLLLVHTPFHGTTHGIENETMTQELSRWGVGPSIATSAGAYAAVASLATWLCPEVCVLTTVPYVVFLAPGIVLLAIGVLLLVIAARAATVAYNSDKLATTGIFGLVRNPIYSAWIVFIIPGLVLMSRSWPLFLTPVVAHWFSRPP